MGGRRTAKVDVRPVMGRGRPASVRSPQKAPRASSGHSSKSVLLQAPIDVALWPRQAAPDPSCDSGAGLGADRTGRFQPVEASRRGTAPTQSGEVAPSSNPAYSSVVRCRTRTCGQLPRITAEQMLKQPILRHSPREHHAPHPARTIDPAAGSTPSSRADGTCDALASRLSNAVDRELDVAGR